MNSFVIAMNGWLSRKCNYGENISVLTPEEKTVYIIDSFQSEVNNGGFSQYLFNSSGTFVGKLAASLSAIGANRTIEIYKKALEKLPHELPADDGRRNALLEELITEDISEVFASCDRQFFEYPDNLDELIYQFIMNKKVVLYKCKAGASLQMFPPYSACHKSTCNTRPAEVSAGRVFASLFYFFAAEMPQISTLTAATFNPVMDSMAVATSF